MATRTRVLFVSHSAAFAGAEQVLLSILKHMDRHKYEVYLACPREGRLVDEAKKLQIPTHLFPYQWWVSFPKHYWILPFFVPMNIIAAFLMASFIKREKIEVVYSNAFTVIAGALASRLSKCPHIWHIHEPPGNQKNQYSFLGLNQRTLESIITCLSSGFIVSSLDTKKCFSESSHPKLRLIYYGFEEPKKTNNEDKTRDASRDQYNARGSSPIISVVASIQKHKGQQYAIMAMKKIVNKFKSAKLLVAGAYAKGTDSYKRELEEFIEANQLKENIAFTGFERDISKIYLITDFLVVPSLHEPFGRICVEAMQRRIPVIATRSGGPNEIIRDGETGLLVDTANADQIADAVTELVEDPAKKDACVRNAYEDVKSRFSIAQMMQATEKLIEEVRKGQP